MEKESTIDMLFRLGDKIRESALRLKQSEEREIVCSNCVHDICFYHKPPKCHFKPKIKKTVIPQMTEEQADRLITNDILVFFPLSEITSDLKNSIKFKMEKSGYIIKEKSELKTLMDEWNYIVHDSRIDYSGEYKKNIMAAEKLIQLMKKDHPEFKK